MIPGQDTIAAIATAVGPAGIGIIRLSGPSSLPMARRLFQPKKDIESFQSHRLYLGLFVDPSTGKALDEVLLSFMKGPHSYTGEDLVEINSHSGYFLLSKLLQVVLDQGARLANPGEFTLRAFLNGRIDLTQAEAVVDVINARSERGLHIASRHIQGAFGDEIAALRKRAVDVLARVEAEIDFPDEEAWAQSCEELAERVETSLVRPTLALLEKQSRNRIWVEGVRTVIVGRVNAGKSSLLNRLLKEERAIVTPVPGTTRDAIESTLTVNGLPLTLTDTAGIRTVKDEVEKIGIQMTEKRAADADFLLVVIDQSRALDQDDLSVLDLARKKHALAVVNKIDLPPALDGAVLRSALAGFPVARVSALTGEGVEDLMQAMARCIFNDEDDTVASRMASRARYGKALADSARFFSHGRDKLRQGAPMEIVALEIRSGLDALGEITGETTAEDVLDSIFTQFCLGK